MNVNPFVIIKHVEKAYGLPIGTICSAKRGKAKSEARAVASYLCTLFTRCSYVEIGEMMNKDHSSVSSGVRKIRHTSDVYLKNIVVKLSNVIRQKHLIEL